MSYYLESPFVELEFDNRPDRWRLLFTAWILFWAAVVIGLTYGFAFVLPGIVGFKPTVLIGIVLLILSNQ